MSVTTSKILEDGERSIEGQYQERGKRVRIGSYV